MCFLCSAQPDFKDEASRVPPSPKRIQNYPTQSYPNPNISYRQPVSHENTQHDDSDDSTATHIIEKSDLFNVNGRPKSSIVYSKDSVTVTRPTTCGSESRTDLKFTVEIEPVEQVTIKTPPKTPERSVIYTKSPTPSPYRSTTPCQVEYFKIYLKKNWAIWHSCGIMWRNNLKHLRMYTTCIISFLNRYSLTDWIKF